MPRARAKAAWRRTFGARAGRECLYAFLSLPTAYVGVAVVLVTVVLSALAAVVLVVVPLLVLVLRLDRAVAGLQRALAGSLLRLRIAKPVRPRRQRGAVGLLAHHLADPVAWRAVGCFAVRTPVGVAQFAVGFLPWLYGLLFLTYPVVYSVLRTVNPADEVHTGEAASSYALRFGDLALDTWPRQLAVSGVGALMLVAAPWLTHGVLALDRWLLPRLLGPSESSLRIRELEETRYHAINEATSTLRRVERDLHDGAQARLVALGMRLGRVESLLDRADVAPARDLVRESRDEVKGIVVSLRELARGVLPPALDGGLEPALATLAARASTPTTVRVDLATRPPAAVETMLYFAAAELLANAGKHSRATGCSIGVATDGVTLRLTVGDDGVGGASPHGAGSGLRGLAERVRTLGGSLAVSSPPGGPTTVTVDVPVDAAGPTTATPEPAATRGEADPCAS